MRKEILNLLAQQQGEFISGEGISQSLKITRAAVWKQIQSLKDSGYEIEAQTKKGYRLVNTPLNLDEWAIERELKTEILGRSFRLYDELSSTNDWAKEWARQGAGHGAVVLAKRQTMGRGRLQRAWESPMGGLWMSVILKPNLDLAEAAKLTLSAGVALAQVCRSLYDLEVQIKWPNDLVYQGRKVAGILGEVVGEWNTVQSIVLGIGINANFSREELHPEFPATTLSEHLGKEINLNSLACELLYELEKEIHALERKDSQGLKERWISKAVGIGSMVAIERAGQKWMGTFKGIKETGELILEQEGQDIYFSSGDVSFRALDQYSPSS